MRKYILSFLIASLMPFTVSAQSARNILDATAARLSAPGGIKAQFKATQFNGTSAEGEATGTLLLRGRAYQVTTNELITWYNGTTQWSMMRGGDEVNVTTPSEAEQAQLNPATLINIYKKGYKYTLNKSTLRGHKTFVVHLIAKSKKAYYPEIFIDVEQGTYTPLCFRAKHDGNWMRLSVLSFTSGLDLPASEFTFPAKDYPNVEVIDLR